MRKLYTAWENINSPSRRRNDKVFGISKEYDASSYIFENNFVHDYQRSHSLFNLLNIILFYSLFHFVLILYYILIFNIILT